MTSHLRRFAILAIGAALGGCDMQPDPPPGPTPVGPARFVNVTVEYRQPSECVNAQGPCGNAVVFLGSWMNAGQEVYLSPDPGSHVWTGVAPGVPVNWPPVEEPHLVRVFDPHLYDTATKGVTAARLVVGGQSVDTYDQPGTPDEAGLVYVDDNGVGRNPI
jgi:hypothetical protein